MLLAALLAADVEAQAAPRWWLGFIDQQDRAFLEIPPDRRACAERDALVRRSGAGAGAVVLSGRAAWRSLADPRLLQRYARRRIGPTLAMAHLTDGLLHLFASPAPLVRELRNRGLTLVNTLTPLKRLLAARALGG